MKTEIKINDRFIGDGRPVYIIAEISANHSHDFSKAVRLIQAAKKAGADAVKLQTYKPETMTIDCDNEYFRIKGTIWEGKTLYQLYEDAYMPWKWQPDLKKIAIELGIDFFSSPFDTTAVDFLEEIGVRCYKVASFEILDIPLLQKIAKTGKPIIMSTGMASLGEIDEAVDTIRSNGNNQLALLKCTSAYPAPPDEANLKTIKHLADAFGVPVGLSDHSMGSAVAVAAVALGARIIEKHFTLSRNDPGPDSSFSMEPYEFKQMVEDIRTVEKALGKVTYEITEKQKESRCFRRSLFIVNDIKAGESFTRENIRSIRPGYGLHTRYIKEILGRKAKIHITKGTPLSWDLFR
ncbi:MAG: pseudaminic acid synthase [Desulfobacteraceae bacterium]|jgi:pseudaminic acid synthase|nr:pseudaminic acid synthase [Desulfobacteraceae bacterium]